MKRWVKLITSDNFFNISGICMYQYPLNDDKNNLSYFIILFTYKHIIWLMATKPIPHSSSFPSLSPVLSNCLKPGERKWGERGCFNLTEQVGFLGRRGGFQSSQRSNTAPSQIHFVSLCLSLSVLLPFAFPVRLS